MWGAAQGLEIDLTYTWGGTYRTLAQQEQVFLQRWQPTSVVAGSVFYAGQRWRLRAGVARAAVPGTSNHGLGLAVDIAAGSSPRVARPITPHLPWLVDNAISFGWCWDTDAEPWHLNYFPGDAIPDRVSAFEDLLAQSVAHGA
jgi:LAS superfamily LD-carboxypeptidase LdcB